MPRITREVLEEMSVEDLQNLKRQVQAQVQPTTGQRLQRGFGAAMRAVPGVLGFGQKTKEPGFYEKEAYKQRIKGKEKDKPIYKTLDGRIVKITPLGEAEEIYKTPEEERGERPGKTVKDLKDSAKLKIIEGGTVEDLTEEEKMALGEERLAEFSPKIEKSPEFRPGTGGLISRIGSFRSPTQAELGEEERGWIQNIKTEADLEEFMQDYENGLVPENIYRTIMEYFGKGKSPVSKAWPGGAPSSADISR